MTTTIIETELERLQREGNAPSWMDQSGFSTLSAGYLLEDETPKGMYERLARTAAAILDRPDLESRFFDLFWDNWLCPASPVCSNFGSDRGLPISCYAGTISDSIDGIFQGAHETAVLSKNGGGVGHYWGDVRGRGVAIKGNGFSEGIVPWLKLEDTVISSVSQGGVRRGASANYLPIRHPDIEEFLDIRRQTGDDSRRCRSIGFHHAVSIPDEFMESVRDGNPEDRALWSKLLTTRWEMGEPYIFFHDNVNNQAPQLYKDKGMEIKSSNLCLSGDTEVLTSNGPRQIRDLVGEVVEVFDGEEWVKNESFKMTSPNENLLKITFRDNSFVKCTPYHKFFLLDGSVITAEELIVGDKLEYHTQEISGTVEPTSAYLKGFLIADGTHLDDKPLLNIYEPKYICIDRLIASAEETPPGEGFRSDIIEEVDTIPNGDNRRVLRGISCRREELFDYSTRYKTEFPIEVYEWTEAAQADFLAGLYDGDGSVIDGDNGSRCYQISLTGKEFLYGLQSFLKAKGIYSTLGLLREAGETDFNDGYGPYETQACWRLTVSDVSARTMSKLVNFTRLKNFDTEGGYNIKPYFSTVREIEECPAEPVYCTNVATTHKFALANGVMSGNCIEIALFTDEDHTFVCCLSSMNLARYDEWKDTDAVELSIYFLDAVMQEFIDKAKHIPGFEKAVRFAEKSRALGLGALGWHTLLQYKGIPFESFSAMTLNNEVFRTIKEKSSAATQRLAQEYGEPEWCKGYGVRNSHTNALAPTLSNSIISGGLSEGIQPIVSNVYAQKTAKGTFMRRNPALEMLLESKGKNTFDVWNQINSDKGSVKNLDFLSDDEKEIYLTAREINQFALVRQAAQRQRYIDQGQSLNLFFSTPEDSNDEETKAKLAKYVHEVHMEAWETGVKTLYYLRTTSPLKGDSIYSTADECKACEA